MMELDAKKTGIRKSSDTKKKKIKEKEPTPEVKKQTDKVYNFFVKLAGDDMEVDWMELKDILDYAMKAELSDNQVNVDEVQASTVHKTESSVPNNSGSNILTALLGLICNRFCKDTPLADLVPNPEHVSNTEGSPSAVEMRNRGFSRDVCRSMVAMMDYDRSGKLGFEEFKALWLDVKHWKSVFNQYDIDNSLTLSGFELRQALNSAGYKLNNRILNVLMHRYGNKNAELDFDDFIMCAVKLKSMIATYKKRDVGNRNQAIFTMEEWVETTLYS